MASGLHSRQTANDGVHLSHSFEYSSEANRLADSRSAGPKDSDGNYRKLDSTDLKKLALQTDTNKLYILSAIGSVGSVYGSQSPTWVSVAPSGAGTGDVVGPASSVDDTIPVYSGTTGKLLKATADSVTITSTPGGAAIGGSISTVAGVDLSTAVIGPSSATDSVVVAFDGTTGKLVKGTSLAAADVVTGPASSVDNQIARFDSTTGKVIQNGTDAPTYDDAGTIDLPAGNITLAVSATVDGRDVSADGTALDGHIAATANPHATDVANLGTGTKAELVGRLTDASALLSDVVEDTSPQLGSDLDVNGNDLVSVSDGDIDLKPDGSGNVVVGATAGTGNLVVDLPKIITPGSSNESLCLQPDGNGVVKVINSSAYSVGHDLGTTSGVGTTTLDMRHSNSFKIVLAHAQTFAFTATSFPFGVTGTLMIVQDGTGGHVATWPASSDMIWSEASGSGVLSTAADAVDWVTFVSDGTKINAVLAKNFA